VFVILLFCNCNMPMAESKATSNNPKKDSKVRSTQVIKKDHDYRFKIAMLGNMGVGKTSIVKRFTENIFEEQRIPSSPTIGSDRKSRLLKVDGKGTTCLVDILDTQGEERFHVINTSSFYRGTSGVLLVSSITDKSSSDKLKNWIDEIKKYEVPIIAVVGNKCDLNEKRTSSKNEIEELMKLYGITHMETSAKSGVKVTEAFQSLLLKIIQKKDPK